MGRAGDVLLYAAAAAGALGVLWRSLKPFRELLRRVRLFLIDWLGTPARPGVAAVPSFPERMGEVESATVAVAQALADLAGSVSQLHTAQEHAAEAFVQLDNRVTDHRNRNEKQAELLQAALQERLDRLQLQNDAYRASLVELGIDVDLPPTPPERPRA